MLWDYNWNAKIVVAIYIHTDSNNVPYPVISVRIKLSLSQKEKVNKQYNPSDCVCGSARRLSHSSVWAGGVETSV